MTLAKPVRQAQLQAGLLRLLGSSSVERVTATGRSAELRDETAVERPPRRRDPPGQRWSSEADVARAVADLDARRRPRSGRRAVAAAASNSTPAAAPTAPGSRAADSIRAGGAGLAADPVAAPPVARSAPRRSTTTTRSGTSIMPRGQPRRRRPSLARAGFRARTPRPRILLVEDNAVNQRVGEVMVEKRGYRVDVAATARGGRGHARRLRRGAHGLPDAALRRLLGDGRDPRRDRASRGCRSSP